MDLLKIQCCETYALESYTYLYISQDTRKSQLFLDWGSVSHCEDDLKKTHLLDPIFLLFVSCCSAKELKNYLNFLNNPVKEAKYLE